MRQWEQTPSKLQLCVTYVMSIAEYEPSRGPEGRAIPFDGSLGNALLVALALLERTFARGPPDRRRSAGPASTHRLDNQVRTIQSQRGMAPKVLVAVPVLRAECAATGRYGNIA